MTTAHRIIDTGSAYKIEDANGRGLAFVYYRREEALRGEYMAPDEARAVAIKIARALKE